MTGNTQRIIIGLLSAFGTVATAVAQTPADSITVAPIDTAAVATAVTTPAPALPDEVQQMLGGENADVNIQPLNAQSEPISAISEMFADTLVHTTPKEKHLQFLPVAPLPAILFMPMIYDEFVHIDSINSFDPAPQTLTGSADIAWVKVEENRARRFREIKQRYMLDNIRAVRYNINTLPKPPKKYVGTIDPSTESITVKEISTDRKGLVVETALPGVSRINWLHTVDGRLQFSQAYISPNWYQGGNNNVNGLGSFRWNVKLNQRFYPKYMVEATLDYKVGIASAPQDTVHGYNITQDQLQFNATAGLRAWDRWYYSVNTSFKTQLLNSYKPNSRDLKSAFMTPGELNVGVGMTYNYLSPNNKFKVDASVSPFSYNLKVATNPGIPKQNFGIEEPHNTLQKFGSNAEIKMNWNIAWNVTYNSRLFLFSDYEALQGDWEHTINMSLNRYFSTQLYLHMRYDSQQPAMPDTKWQHWQLKEILSFGFQYQFKTI